jgi:hypothetical protein
MRLPLSLACQGMRRGGLVHVALFRWAALICHLWLHHLRMRSGIRVIRSR